MMELDEIRAAFLRGDIPVWEGDPVQIADDYNAVARDLFWMDRNLPATRTCLEAGLAFCANQPSSVEIQGKEKALCYNLGSFCWPGWAEEGIVPTTEDVLAGESGANRNLELGEALGRGPGPMANAHWLVGAYHLHRDRRDQADASFARAEAIADDEGVRQLMTGYRQLTAFDDQGFEATCRLLQEVGGEDGAFYVHQLQTAWWVYNFADEAA